MTPILIEPLSEKAYELLRQLEALHILRVVTSDSEPVVASPVTPPRKWAGALAGADADSLRAHAEQIRNEWERDIQ